MSAVQDAQIACKKTVIEISRNYKTTTRNPTTAKTKNTSRPFHLATYKKKMPPRQHDYRFL
jgi:hypothetical protein